MWQFLSHTLNDDIVLHTMQVHEGSYFRRTRFSSLKWKKLDRRLNTGRVKCMTKILERKSEVICYAEMVALSATCIIM